MPANLTSLLARYRRQTGGVLLMLMVLTTLYIGIVEINSSYKDFWISGLLATLAALLLIPDAKFAQRIQLSVLVSVGLSLLFVALNQGAQVQWSSLLSQNTGLLSMLFTVGLLKLIVVTAVTGEQKLPIGRKAFLHTLLTVVSFSSIINISGLVVVSDRLSLNRPLNYFNAGTLVRAFSGCAVISPFFAGMAAVLTVIGEEHLLTMMLHGLPLTLMFIVVLYVSGVILHKEKLDAFHGYPIKIESFFVPVLLGVLVLFGRFLFPSAHILSVIALSSITLTFVLLVKRQGLASTVERLGQFIREDLPNMVGELQLFLSAGILAFGLQALVQAGSLTTPVSEYTGLAASVLLGIFLVAAFIGIHPLIFIASLTPVLAPINPEPVLLGLTYIFGWSLGTCISPLSGTNLIMQGRFGINAMRGAIQNLPYIVVLYVIACIILFIRYWYAA